MNGQDLRQARERAGLTQAQAARKIGVPVDTYRSWEHGRRSPREEHVDAIARVMAGEPTPRDEIAGLRELVNQLAGQVRDLAVEVVALRRELDERPAAR
jgi:transcriptional regulator with XRE-family HTH domain